MNSQEIAITLNRIIHELECSEHQVVVIIRAFEQELITERAGFDRQAFQAVALGAQG